MNANNYLLIKTADENNNGIGTGSMIGGGLALGGLGAIGYGNHKAGTELFGEKGLFGNANATGVKNAATDVDNQKSVISEFKKNNGGDAFDASKLDENNKTIFNEHQKSLQELENVHSGTRMAHYGKIGGILGGGMMLGSMLTNNN